MRIDQLKILNFKKFSDFTLDLHPQLTLIVGNNGSGKTSLLNALTIAASVWLVEPPDTTLRNSRRNILGNEIHLEAIQRHGVTQFVEHKPVKVTAIGQIGDQQVEWTRQIKKQGSRTSNNESKAALALIVDLFEQDQVGQNIWLPITAYYSAGRLWISSNKASQKDKHKLSRRWFAFDDCFEGRIRPAYLQDWF